MAKYTLSRKHRAGSRKNKRRRDVGSFRSDWLRRLALAFALLLPVGVLAGVEQAQASIGYTTHSCTAGSGTSFVVTSWYNDTATQKTYHYAAKAKGYSTTASVSYSTDTVYWQGFGLADNGSSVLIEGYRYKANTGGANGVSTPWKATFKRYNFGVPTGSTSCSFTA